MSWLYSRELAVGLLPHVNSAGAQSALSRSTSMPLAFCVGGKTKGFCRPSLSGQTFEVLTDDLGAELLTSYLEAFRAKTLALQEASKESTARNQDCGEKWRASFAKFDRDSCGWKTAQTSLLGESEESSVIWPRSGMMRGGACSELPPLAPLTSASECGSGLRTPTPISSDADKCSSDSLARFVQPGLQKTYRKGNSQLWPTPTVQTAYQGPNSCAGGSSQGRKLLNAAVLPTPISRDWKSGKASEATKAKNSRPLSEAIGGLLNPEWVEWLMGWPVGWTELKPSATGRSQPAPLPRGECWADDLPW